MARPSIPSTTLLAAVRRHFGLQQNELAAYLGISPAQVGHLEAGRRTLTEAVLLRLAPLAALLDAPDAPPTPAAAPDPALLDARRDFCQWRAANLRYRLRPLEARAARARRWQQVLPGLLAATPPPTERTRQWLLRRQAEAAADLGATASAEQHLLRLQAEALEAEADAITALIGPGTHG